MKYLIIVILFSIPLFAVKSMHQWQQFCCVSSDGGDTVDDCRIKGIMLSSDGPEFAKKSTVPVTDLTSGQKIAIANIIKSNGRDSFKAAKEIP